VAEGVGGVAQVMELLPRKREVLSSSSSTEKGKKKKNKLMWLENGCPAGNKRIPLEIRRPKTY
jgi:hypothetical protein